ncbi:MAG: hypothetical protein M9941_06425 [Anaerolineae bacterium]|nr:hypothetical protein [Anaerolineae bacterium]MCO5194277.1 hypothetical protein [Anaerolineae bacterium]MCO5197371.1 hypothetical protein [Anaerolineae bacterium]
MSEATNKKFNWRDPGFLGEMFGKVRLALYLLRDPEVPFYLKVIPFTAVAYWLFPFEGVVNPLLLTPVDDIALFVVSITTFLQLAPPHVVAKYEAKMAGRPNSAEDVPQANVVDGEFETIETGDDTIDPLDEIIILNPDKINGYH